MDNSWLAIIGELIKQVVISSPFSLKFGKKHRNLKQRVFP